MLPLNINESHAVWEHDLDSKMLCAHWDCPCAPQFLKCLLHFKMVVVGNIKAQFIPKYTHLKAAQVPFLLSLSKLHPNSQMMIDWLIEDFIYSWEAQRERQRHRLKEKQAPCGELVAGLDPRTPGSWLELSQWATRHPTTDVFKWASKIVKYKDSRCNLLLIIFRQLS